MGKPDLGSVLGKVNRSYLDEYERVLVGFNKISRFFS